MMQAVVPIVADAASVRTDASCVGHVFAMRKLFTVLHDRARNSRLSNLFGERERVTDIVKGVEQAESRARGLYSPNTSHWCSTTTPAAARPTRRLSLTREGKLSANAATTHVVVANPNTGIQGTLG